MCSILGSFTKEDLVKLAKLNEYRGQHSHSISFYSVAEQKLVSVQKGMGPLPIDRVHISPGYYCICHMQAPTTEAKSIESVHPAESYTFTDSYLWHNGILKPETIEDIRYAVHFDLNDVNWDTKLLVDYINRYGFGVLDKVDGTFACLYAEADHYNTPNGQLHHIHELYLFRNEIAPMFVDDKYNLSSTKFDGSRSLEPNVVWRFEPGVAITDSGHHFKTAENPYYFG